MSLEIIESIDQNGYPLAFATSRAPTGSPVPGEARVGLFRVEARQLAGHQKEAIVSGAGFRAWRLVSDEGSTLKGTDLAPFPLGFFNAGIQADLGGRLRGLAVKRGIALDSVDIQLVNGYGFTGSFMLGTGQGHAVAPALDITLGSPTGATQLRSLVDAALQASPAIALLRTPLAKNPFALYINGRRRHVAGVPECGGADAVDPYRVYRDVPRPLPGTVPDLIVKVDPAARRPTPAASLQPKAEVSWNVFGVGTLAADGMYETETWLGLPNSSHFRLRTDEARADRAPCGLALVSAAISFCYMTQLSRYIEGMKMKIGQVRLVQFNTYSAGEQASAGPIETHLYLNGEAAEETHLHLLTIAAHTCYLHAAARASLQPSVRLHHKADGSQAGIHQDRAGT